MGYSSRINKFSDVIDGKLQLYCKDKRIKINKNKRIRNSKEECDNFTNKHTQNQIKEIIRVSLVARADTDTKWHPISLQHLYKELIDHHEDRTNDESGWTALTTEFQASGKE